MSDSEEDHHSDGEGGQDGANPKEWVRTVATHLNFIGGFNAFPGKRPGRMASSIVFDAVRTCNADRARQLHPFKIEAGEGEQLEGTRTGLVVFGWSRAGARALTPTTLIAVGGDGPREVS